MHSSSFIVKCLDDTVVLDFIPSNDKQVNLSERDLLASWSEAKEVVPGIEKDTAGLHPSHHQRGTSGAGKHL